MSIAKTLHDQMISAMKDKNAKRLSVIRMLMSELKNEEKSGGKKRTEEEVCFAYHKKLIKALDMFPEDKKVELREEIKIVEEFLPKLMTKDEVVDFIKKNVKPEEVNMRTVMPLLKGKADSQVIKDIVDNWNK
ncbi:MAG: GatB/YqeY domain-containing protein [Proteobacteria bacterium]|nr:GatB/YqeY domain-containing protein [Pseudomonadota bacterium]